jgi:hypothetical protein
MKHIVTVLTIAALMAVMVFAGAGYAFAFANPDNEGNASNAPGQNNAQENCFENITRQLEKGLSAGGGPKEGTIGTTNCDKFFTKP